jgi:predicted TPR repeat methyltransferase
MTASAFDNPLDEARTLLETGNASAAAGLLETLIREGHGGLLARLLRAQALAESGDPGAAFEVARETAALYPGIAEAALGLGKILLKTGQLPVAIAEFQRALRLDPGLADARFLLGTAWLEAGEAGRALAAFGECPPATPGLTEKTARAEAMAAAPRSDAGYVRHLFDQFSADYDARMLTQLSYRAPQILRELAGLVMPGMTGLDILDLGCGTGLSGAVFKDRAASLDGIDLSPAMIAKAKERGVYDALAVGDIEAGLGLAVYDLVVAADTLVYLGDLEPVLAAVAAALRTEGFFLFSVEAKEGEGFELGPKRRWRHSQSYLRALAAQSGFTVAGLMACVPRHEAHEAVNGYAVALQKQAVQKSTA